jgi:predicted chitinase/GNAT superfamily N-acetyltransferase
MIVDDLFRESDSRVQAWIDQVYRLYPMTWQNNHVMTWGDGPDQELAMFELVPNPSRPGAVEVKWFQAYPLRRGVGSRAMRELQRLARDNDIALTLYAWDKGQVSRSKLMKFYRQMGFSPTAKHSASMIWRPEPLDEVTIDNREGAGAVPYNADVDYFGLRVQMRPSTFLKLAAPLGGAHSEKLEQYIAQGGAIGAPFLMVDIPEGWEAGDFSQWAEVTGHEGRNRVSAVRKLEGDEPIEMHIFPRYLRRRHLTPQWIAALNQGLIGEGTGRRVSGPLFGTNNLEEGWREKTAALATAATLGLGAYHNATRAPAPAPQPQVSQADQRDQALAQKVPAAHQSLVQQARAAGIRGQELAHFIAQMAHETGNWRSMEEQPPRGAKNPQRYFARKYDGRKILGNRQAGDGYRFRGRGYVQLTGRYNYTRAAQALGLDLVNNPDLASDPDVAARVAVWFWQKRVAPRVADFDQATVQDVTHGINPGQRGAAQRQAQFHKVSQR